MNAETVILGVLVAAMFVALTLFVTYLYLERIRKGDRGHKSFLVWLRDLLDLILGL